MVDLNTHLAQGDPEVPVAIEAELRRQQGTLEMIASENFAPVAESTHDHAEAAMNGVS